MKKRRWKELPTRELLQKRAKQYGYTDPLSYLARNEKVSKRSEYLLDEKMIKEN